MKRVGGCTVPLADWPLFHCIGQVVGGGGGGGGGGGLLRINYEDFKVQLVFDGPLGFLWYNYKYIYM